MALPTIAEIQPEIETLQGYVDAADRASAGDSNDTEIGALRDALEHALYVLNQYGWTFEHKDWDSDEDDDDEQEVG